MSAIYPILMLGGLVFFHEFGHFIVARLCGITVLEFSIGFGPRIGSFERWGTTWKIGALPLGGYVKMLGHDPLGDPADYQQPGSFATKPLWQRSLVVLAGPVFNLILPFFIFFTLYASQDMVSPASVGAVQPSGPAARAGMLPGDVIVEIDGEPIVGWWQLSQHFAPNPGTELEVVVDRAGERVTMTMTPAVVEEVLVPLLGLKDTVGRVQITPTFTQPYIAVTPSSAAYASGLRNWDRVLTIDGQVMKTYPEAQRAFGKLTSPAKVEVLRHQDIDVAVPGGPVQFQAPTQRLTITYDPSSGPGGAGIRSSEFVVRLVNPSSPEWKAGLRAGDEIVALDGRGFINWATYIREADAHPNKERELTFMRGDRQMKGQLVYARKKIRGPLNREHEVTDFGASNLSAYVNPDPIENERPMAFAWFRMWDETWSRLRHALASVTGLLSGKVSTDQLAGPVFIFQASAFAGEAGWATFFEMMAMLSMSLGFINLLPIPLLDGGHLLFFVIEAVKRSPVSLRTRQIASYVGFSFIIIVFLLVTRQDILHAFFPQS